MMNPIWLNTFCTLVDIGHFTKTAEVLFMTQSGVSQHIKKLEAYLGIELLIREGKSFSLTDSGQKLYLKGGELLRSAQVLEDLLLKDEKYEGLLRIASPGSVGLKLYPHLLGIQKEYPELIIDYRFAPNKQIEQDIIDRKIDLGLITKQSILSSLVSEKISDEPLVLVTHCSIEDVSWASLIELGFISHPDGNHHGRMLLSENYIEFQNMEEIPVKGFSNQISLILEPVSRGIGFTVLPLYAVTAFNKQDSIRVHYLNNPISESIFCCTHSKSLLANRIKFIKAVIEQHLN